LIIHILYGAEYDNSIGILRLAVWYTTFSYLGSARTVWILAEEKHNILWKVNLIGALCNVLLNSILIPPYGAMGAATASLITQFFTNVILGYIIKPVRENNRLMLQGINPFFLLAEAKSFRKKAL
jgi:O-antigen/teichoic acid export membrane protein